MDVAEGCFAINKPAGLSSADVVRILQLAFKPSRLFQPWFKREAQAVQSASATWNRVPRNLRRRQQKPQIKMGHGGTLDPMATGVLIIGVGAGTKSLGRFLSCKKTYETVVLFGAATDTYDCKGKVVARARHEHITRSAVEEALAKFRGNIMQKPPIYSALRIQGKRLYEYAREGKELPREIEERPVTVDRIEVVEWLEGGSHSWFYPEDADGEDKAVAQKLINVEDVADTRREAESSTADPSPNGKRKRDCSAEGSNEATAEATPASSKRQKPSAEAEEAEAEAEPSAHQPPPSEAAQSKESDQAARSDVARLTERLESKYTSGERPGTQAPGPAPPAARIRMTVSSGFYVRSLAHDLGAAVGSLGFMTELERSQQERFEVGRNVLEWEDIDKGEDVWGPQLEDMLKSWNSTSRAEEAEAAGE